MRKRACGYNGTTDKAFAPSQFGSGRFLLGGGKTVYYQFKLNGYTIQDLVILCRVTAKRYRWARTLLFRGIALILGLIMLGMGALILAAEGSTVLGIALILLSLLYLALSIFYYRLTAWRSSRMQIKDVGEITIFCARN